MTDNDQKSQPDWAAGVEGFLHSDALAVEARTRVGNPNPVKPWLWDKHIGYLPGLSLSGTPTDDGLLQITRHDVFQLAETARSTNGTTDLHSLFWTVMAWGIAGNMRNVGRMAAFAAESTDRLSQTLRRAAEASYAGAPQDAYLEFSNDGKVPRLGPAFFSKFLYFTGNRESTSRRCFIYDDRVHTALNIVKGQQPQLTSSTYADYSATVHRWSLATSDVAGSVVTPDEIEFRLYLLGQDAGSQLGWLRTEVSLHRQRGQSNTFDSVLSHITVAK